MKKKDKVFIKELKVTDEKMSIFSYKGSLIFSLFLIFGTMVFPSLLGLTGISSNLSVVLGTTIFGGFGTSYVRNFIDTKKGFGVVFIVQLFIFGGFFFLISYAWMYLGLYI